MEFYEGDKIILDYLEEDDFAYFDASLEQVPEGQRNSTMSHIAGKIIKRYGNTEEAYQIFLKKAELCNSPLPESELKVIWRSASKFDNKVSNQEDMLTVGCRRNVKPEFAEAKGKRMLIAAELEEGMRLNTANVKQLCSTDEIYAEKKYKDLFSYTPTHILMLYTNHLPKIGAIDKST